jgi:hypothetical protein
MAVVSPSSQANAAEEMGWSFVAAPAHAIDAAHTVLSRSIVV